MLAVRERSTSGPAGRAPARRPEPSLGHQRAVLRVAEVLAEYGRTYGGEAIVGPVLLVLPGGDLIRPDVVFITQGKRRWLDAAFPVRVVPDLTVTVLDADERSDEAPDLGVLARQGVGEHWLVDPRARRVEVRAGGRTGFDVAQRAEGEDVVRSARLPYLCFSAARLFCA